MKNLNMQTRVEQALEKTEANGLILGYCQHTNRAYVLPCWEAETRDDVESAALANALTWADENGAGTVEVVWAFRDDEAKV
jgi:hypothetical protein